MVYEKKYKDLVFLEKIVRLKDGEGWSFMEENVEQIKDGKELSLLSKGNSQVF